MVVLCAQGGVLQEDLRCISVCAFVHEIVAGAALRLVPARLMQGIPLCTLPHSPGLLYRDRQRRWG